MADQPRKLPEIWARLNATPLSVHVRAVMAPTSPAPLPLIINQPLLWATDNVPPADQAWAEDLAAQADAVARDDPEALYQQVAESEYDLMQATTPQELAQVMLANLADLMPNPNGSAQA